MQKIIKTSLDYTENIIRSCKNPWKYVNSSSKQLGGSIPGHSGLKP